MPSFDIVSEVDAQEVDNALNQARKEIVTRFDFKNSLCEILVEKEKIKLRADNATLMRSLQEIVISKLARRNVPLQNIDRSEVQISSTGHAAMELTVKRGIEHEKAKEINQAIRDSKLKVTTQQQEKKIRVTGKSRDELQAVITLVRSKDFGVALSFENFRN
ncbi:MAG: YajQ family cyclic di-GMP-binding protein [Verrucomicrobiia bacterium]